MPLRAYRVAAISAANDDSGGRSAFEHVEFEVVGQFFAYLNAPRAVTLFIQRSREGPDTELAGQDGNDAAADAALGRGRPGNSILPRSRTYRSYA